MNTQTIITIEVCQIDKNTLKMIEDYERISAQVSILEKQKAALKETLAETTHHAAHIVDSKGNEVASWSEQVRKILDTTRLKVEQHELYEEYLTDSRFYVFNVTKH